LEGSEWERLDKAQLELIKGKAKQYFSRGQ